MSHEKLPGMTIVTAADVLRQVESNRSECIEIVRQAYLAYASGACVNPHSTFLRPPDRPRARIISLPAYLGGQSQVAGIKWIASYPENLARGIPRASAVLILNDVDTGLPYACMEGSIISATRTAASAALALEELTGGLRNIRIGFVGTGLIATHVYRFLRERGWPITAARLFDLRRDAATGFADLLSSEGRVPDVKVVDDAATVFRESDVITLATVASEPHINDAALLEHKPIVLHLSLRDLAPEMLLLASNLTDDIDHVLRERTSAHLAEQRCGHRRFMDGTLSDVLQRTLRLSRERAAIFSPFGLGVLDLAVGRWVYERVVSNGGGQSVPDFFRGV